MNSLTESHIFIAGGSRGIGAAAAKLAAQAGAKVSITYHQRSDAADAVVAAITAAGGKAAAFKANVADEKQVSPPWTPPPRNSARPPASSSRRGFSSTCSSKT